MVTQFRHILATGFIVVTSLAWSSRKAQAPVILTVPLYYHLNSLMLFSLGQNR